MTRKEIIERHNASLKGTLCSRRLSSAALGIRKSYYIYEPDGFSKMSQIPCLYLFRGHQREWVNFHEDASRKLSTAIEDVDKAISLGIIPPLLIVMPGLNSSNNHIPSLGINMGGTWPASVKGLGTGRFWDFLLQELMPSIQKRYPQARGEQLAAGFSLGGYTTSLLTVLKPGTFDQVGIYDGLFMWPDHHDPRALPDEAGNDTVWTNGRLFDAAFGNPSDMALLNRWNPTNTLLQANEYALHALRKTTWWISCAASDGRQGNRDRATFYRQMLKQKSIPTGFDQVLFAPDAAHSWHWADKFLISFLQAALKRRQLPGSIVKQTAINNPTFSKN